MPVPYISGDTPTDDEFNEAFEIGQGRTIGTSPDRRLKLEETSLRYGIASIVASASTIALGDSYNYTITGTTNISTITAIGDGKEVSLKFDSPLTLLNTGNIKSIGTGNFPVFAGTVVKLLENSVGDWDIISSNSELIRASSTVASASTITVGKNKFYEITGTTDIQTINTIEIGHEIKLKFADNLTLLSSGNIKTPGNLNFNVFNNVIVTLYQFDASNWIILSSNKLLTKPVFEATMAADQTGIVSGVDTKVNYDTEVLDTHNTYNPSLQRFVAPIAGKYFIEARFELLSPSNGTLIIARVRKNGSNIMQDTEVPGADKNVVITSNGLLNLVQNDFIEVFVQHDAIANKTISSVTTLTRFTGVLID